jgi:hypothetical protein
VNRQAYYSVAMLVGGGYSLYVLVLAFQVALKYPHWPAMCRINDLFTLDGLDQWTLRNGLVINGVSFLIYALVWAVIHKIHKSKIQQQPRGAVAVAKSWLLG